MIRAILLVLALIILFTVQVSFIQALPFPFDRIPLVLVVTIYLYQYETRTVVWWWLISYGLVLDVLAISSAPLEVLSYAIVSFSMILLVQHIFTNKSFYGVTATALLSLVVLSISQLGTSVLYHLSGSTQLIWRNILFTNVWAGLFACLLLLFMFPSLKKSWGHIERFVLNRI